MTVTLTPLLEASSVELSESPGRFRKQILPFGDFNYGGKKLNFTEIAKRTKEAFDNCADEITFQWADGNNAHNFDPKLKGGTLAQLELASDGLYGVFDFSKFPETASYVSQNPRFGVSARIEQDLEDGRTGTKYPYYISHVLGTSFPKVSGLKPWEKIDLSNNADPDEEVVDLSTAEGVKMPEEDQKTETPQFTAEEIAAFREMLKNQAEMQAAIEKLRVDEPVEGEDDDEDEEAGKPPVQDDQVVKLSRDAQSAIELARSATRELAVAKWEKTAMELTAAGVPPVAVNLAKDIMSTPDGEVSAIELSNGSKVSPKAELMKVLESLKGTIDLSREKGHEFNENAEFGQEGDQDDLDKLFMSGF